MADDSAHHISAEGLAALEAELRALETEGRRAIPCATLTAPALGAQAGVASGSSRALAADSRCGRSSLM
jgi:hypothetical protein